MRRATSARGQTVTEEYGATGLMVGRSCAGSDTGRWRAARGPRRQRDTLHSVQHLDGRELCTEIMVGPDRVPRWPNGAAIGLQRYWPPALACDRSDHQSGIRSLYGT